MIDLPKSLAQALKNPKSLKQYWMDKLDQAKKKNKDWQKSAKQASEIYWCDQKTNISFNILHANTETLIPAIYNTPPIPDIRTRFQDQNEIARKGAQILERALIYSFDEYDAHDSLLSAVKDAMITGRGIIRVRYNPLTRRSAKEDEQGKSIFQEDLIWQSVALDYVPWNHFYHEDAHIWNDVNWIAFLKTYTKEELESILAEKTLKTLDFKSSEQIENSHGKEETTEIYEIWEKTTRKVYFISEALETPISVMEDPLNLLDFFPVPKPFYSLRKTQNLMPIPPYSVYEKQAIELNETTRRILALTKMLKFKGIRASEIHEFDQFENLDDGEFMPSENAMIFLQQGLSLDRALWTMPLERIIQTIRELGAQREQIKQTIYEITGIADIMRGASKTTETATAQQLKAQWGSLRIQQAQQNFQIFARDMIRLKAEIIASHFSKQTLSYLAGEPVEEEVLELLRGDLIRNYTIEIETDSTIRGDMARNQQNMTQFLSATASYLQTLAPALQQGIIPQDLALTIFAGFAKQFKLGKAIEDKLSEHIKHAEEQASQTQKQAEQQEETQQEKRKQEEEAKALNKQKLMLETQKQQAEIEKLNSQTQKTNAETQEKHLENQLNHPPLI